DQYHDQYGNGKRRHQQRGQRSFLQVIVDWFLLFAPVLLLGVVALLRFIGCLSIPDRAKVTSVEINCGGPETDGFSADFGFTGGQPVKGSGIVTDANNNPVSEVYATCRSRDDFSYQIGPFTTNNCVLTMKFAEIDGALKAGQRQ